MRVLLVFPLNVFQGCWILPPILHLLRLPKYAINKKSMTGVYYTSSEEFESPKERFYAMDCFDLKKQRKEMYNI